MKRSLIALALCAAGLAGAQVQTTWVNAPGGVSVARDAADNVFTATWDSNPAGDIYVAKRNAAGALLWEVSFDNTDTTQSEQANWVATDSGGNVLVAGTLRSGFSNPVNMNSILMKFGPGGQLLWRRVFETFFDGSSTRRVLVDAADQVYVLGLGNGPTGVVTRVKKFGADGSDVWSWFDSAGNLGAPILFKRTPDGQLLITGHGITGAFNGYAKISSAGQTTWILPGVQSLTVGDAAGDGNGNSYIVNSNYAAGTGSILRKVSPAGATLWERTLAMSAMRVEVGPDAAPVVSGYPATGQGGAAFAKFSPAGDALWDNPDADGPMVNLLLHAQMLMDTEGSAYLAASNLSQMAVTKVRSNGSADWTALMPGSYANAMTFGSAGQIYVTGGQTARLDAGGTPPPQTVDLALSLADAPDPVKVRGALVYTATVRNLGTAAAAGVSYQQVLPRAVSWTGSTPSQGSCSGTRTVICSLGIVAPGATATVAVMVKPVARGTLAASATVTTTSSDVDTGNNTATASTTVTR
jgi:uncharacterized repeat protein (TIGR01451 family)